MSRKLTKPFLFLALATAVAASSTKVARAEDALEFTTPSVCETEGGSKVSLPSGVLVLPKATFDRLESEYKKQQDEVTRLTAENVALKEYKEPKSYLLWVAAAGFVGGATAAFFIWKCVT